MAEKVTKKAELLSLATGRDYAKSGFFGTEKSRPHRGYIWGVWGVVKSIITYIYINIYINYSYSRFFFDTFSLFRFFIVDLTYSTKTPYFNTGEVRA